MKNMIIIARLFSSIFRPMYYPTVGVIILLTMTYLTLLPLAAKAYILGLVYFFTLFLPMVIVFLYRKIRHLDAHELRRRRNRVVPYIIHLLCYLCCMHVMAQMHLPHFLTAIIVVSLLIQCSCLLINRVWKISMHAAGSGGVIGTLLAYASIFAFNPVWWLCGALLLSGCVMTSRMVLRQHNLAQVIVGTLVGVICGFVGIIFI